MRVTVRLFARLREVAGRETCEVEVPAGATVEDAWQALTRAHPGLAPFGSTVSCAVNADFARRTVRLDAGDDVAFLPPVSGGAPVER